MAKAIKTPTQVIKEEEIIPEIPIVETTPEIKQEEKEIVEIPKPGTKVFSAPVMPQAGLTNEERIVKFIDGAMGNKIRLNDFLKSLYPIPAFNAPAQWKKQGESKQLRGMLDKMVKEGTIKIIGNSHLKLGTFHYPDSTTLKTEYFSLDNVELFVEK